MISTRSGDLAGAHHFCLTASARVSSDLGGRADHSSSHCHLIVFIVSTQPSFLGRRFLRCVATLLLELVFTSSPAHPLRRAYAPTTSSSSSILDWLGLGIKESSLH